jgi:hypothetical protein
MPCDATNTDQGRLPNMLLVQIDFEALIRNLIQQDTGQAWDLESTRDWLRQEGFVEVEHGWQCDEQMLARLDRTEVTSVVRL